MAVVVLGAAVDEDGGAAAGRIAPLVAAMVARAEGRLASEARRCLARTARAKAKKSVRRDLAAGPGKLEPVRGARLAPRIRAIESHLVAVSDCRN